jgi:hypothetical protein
MGHFFGKDLLCEGCKVDYYDHQALPSPCTVRVSFGNKGRVKGVTWLVRFGKHYRVTFEQITERSGVCKTHLTEISTERLRGPERRLVWKTLVALVREKQ